MFWWCLLSSVQKPIDVCLLGAKFGLPFKNYNANMWLLLFIQNLTPPSTECSSSLSIFCYKSIKYLYIDLWRMTLHCVLYFYLHIYFFFVVLLLLLWYLWVTFYMVLVGFCFWHNPFSGFIAYSTRCSAWFESLDHTAAQFIPPYIAMLCIINARIV